MHPIIKSSWKHVLFALAVFGFISCATHTPQRQRPAASARKEGKLLQADKAKKRANQKKTKAELAGGTANQSATEIFREGAETTEEIAEFF